MRAAAVQLNSRDDKDRNLAVADRLTRAAAADGATLVVLPEKFNVLGTHEAYLAGAETLDGPTIELGARAGARARHRLRGRARSWSAATTATSSRTPRCTSGPTAS